MGYINPKTDFAFEKIFNSPTIPRILRSILYSEYSNPPCVPCRNSGKIMPPTPQSSGFRSQW